jgi:hypothetical protein
MRSLDVWFARLARALQRRAERSDVWSRTSQLYYYLAGSVRRLLKTDEPEYRDGRK